MFSTRKSRLTVALLLAAMLSACASSDEPPASTEPTQEVTGYVDAEAGIVAACMQEGDVALELADSGLEALVFGDGEVAVVLAHGMGQGPCAWEAFGRELADDGFTVFMPQMGSNDPVGDLQAAEDWLLAHGADRIALVGASAGAAQVVAAAASLEPAPVAVVGLSTPTDHGVVDALDAIDDIVAPVLLVAGEGDDDFVMQLEELAAAQPDADTIIVERGAHGTSLLEDPAVAASVVALLAAA